MLQAMLDDTIQLMVIHDDRVQRTTNGKGLAEDYTFEQLTKLTRGWQSDPTIGEVTALIGCSISLMPNL